MDQKKQWTYRTRDQTQTWLRTLICQILQQEAAQKMWDCGSSSDTFSICASEALLQLSLVASVASTSLVARAYAVVVVGAEVVYSQWLSLTQPPCSRHYHSLYWGCYCHCALWLIILSFTQKLWGYFSSSQSKANLIIWCVQNDIDTKWYIMNQWRSWFSEGRKKDFKIWFNDLTFYSNYFQ